MKHNDNGNKEYCGINDGDSTPEIDIPDGFESLRDALNRHSTTPRDEQPRCPAESCGSTEIVSKRAAADHDRRQPEPWRCNRCGHHFSEPAAPVADREGEPVATDGGVATDRQSSAGSFESHLRCAVKQLFLARENAPDEWFESALAEVLDDERELYRIAAGEQLDLRGEPEVVADE